MDSDFEDGSGADKFEWDVQLSSPGISGVFTF